MTLVVLTVCKLKLSIRYKIALFYKKYIFFSVHDCRQNNVKFKINLSCCNILSGKAVFSLLASVDVRQHLYNVRHFDDVVELLFLL